MAKISELTLLYVEDDRELREQFVRILQSKFKQVIEAEDGLQALEKYELHNPDMMLVDINIPKIDGLEVIELVRRNDKHTPIIVLSAYSDQIKLLKAIKLGLSDYLIKPVPQKKLIYLFELLAVTFKKRVKEEGTIALKNGYIWQNDEKRLFYNDEIITLTKRERIFFEFMLKQLNKVVTFNSIINYIWEEDEYDTAYSSLSHLLKRLRKKLPEELIENVYGEGYIITSDG